MSDQQEGTGWSKPAKENSPVTTRQNEPSPMPPRTWTLIIHALALAGVIIPFAAPIASVVLAYIKRPELAGTPFESHATYAIRTFWIGLAAGLICFVLMFVVIGFFGFFAVGIWWLYRVIKALVLAIDSRPIPDPETYL